MVLLILVVVWAAVLGPSLLRRRFERRSGDSIGAFHKQLRVLERTGPLLVNPAFRLGAPNLEGQARRRRPQAVVSNRRGLIVVRPDATPPPVPMEESTVRIDPYFRPEACRRRRDVLAGLACVVLGSGLLGVVPVLRPVLGVTGFGLLVSAAYVGLLVRTRTRAIERTQKLRYLPTRVTEEPPFVIHRTAAH